MDLDQADGHIGAVVGHALEVREQVIEDKSRLKRAVPGLEPIHMAQLHLITQDVYPLLQRLHAVSPVYVLVNECRDRQLKYLVHRSAEDEQFALTLRRKAYLLFVYLMRRLADIHRMVADSLEVAERVQVLCGALAVTAAQLSSRQLHQICAELILVAVDRRFQILDQLESLVGIAVQQRNCLDNICFPMELSGLRGEKKWREQRALELLDIVGLKDKAKAYPAQLSGGQQQRVAIARALATNPKVLLCDEATSALDPKTTRQILELIGDINKKLGITVVIITHQMSVVKEVCNHVAILDDGEVVEEGLVSTVFSAPKSAAARHLVFPRGADIDVSDPQQQRRIRLIFRSAKTTSIPLVARLATEENITATVISATTQKLSEEVYGGMLLGVPNAQFEQAMDFLKGIENLQVEEASVDVQ